MNDEIDWRLLAKHFSEECSEEEAVRVRNWIAEDPARKALLNELRRVWQLTAASEENPSDSSKEEPWNTDQLWERVQKETVQAPRPPQRGLERAPSRSAGSAREPCETSALEASQRMPGRRKDTRSPRPTRSTVRRSAAKRWIIMVVIGALAAFWLHGSDAPFGSGAKTFATQPGQRANIQLTDGSRVYLNADSRLTLLSKFGAERRKVRLKGEAYFEVAKDSTRPFIVYAEEATMRVLGTAFNVSAYPSDGGTLVAVKEGRVALRPSRQLSPSVVDRKQELGEQQVVLTRGYVGRLVQGGKGVVGKKKKIKQHLSWMEGRLVFEDASFGEVVRRLERWYGLEIALKETTPPPGHLNAQFTEEQSPEEVLAVVATAFEMQYERVRPAHIIFAPAATSLDLPQHGSRSNGLSAN